MINENKKRGRKKKDSDYNNIFAKNLRKLIDKNKVTHDAIAKKINVTRQAIGKWIVGESVPDVLTLIKIAEYFEVSTDYLLGLSPEPSPDDKIQALNKLTGLSKGAIDNIARLGKEYGDTLNLLFDNIHFEVMIAAISKMNFFSYINIDEFIKYVYESGYKGTEFKIFEESEKYSFIEKVILDNIAVNEYQASKTLDTIMEEFITGKMSTVNDIFDNLPYNVSIYDLYVDYCNKIQQERDEERDRQALESIKEFEEITGQKILILEKEDSENAKHNPKKE